MKLKKIAKNFYLFLVFVFMYAPIVVMAIYSFNDSRSRTTQWKGFTFKWYIRLFEDSQILKALETTLVIAIVSAVVATIIGTLASIGISRMNKKLKNVVMGVTQLPVLNPDIVTGISLMILFVFLKIKLGKYSLLLSHIAFNIPYVIISVLPKFTQLNKSVYEVALDLGATPQYAYRKVVLPQIMPGIITGFLLSVTLSVDDFVISFFTAGTGATNLSIYIYSAISKKYNPSINALSTIMFVVIFLLLLIINSRSKNDNKKTKGVLA
ncbi:MAG: ABC transporter permease [Ruminococcaceae bacterium]|nr:ABC transporter permease [Oscillospiraceae bacterium]